MNSVENVVVDLLKKDLLTIDEVVKILKEINEISDKVVSFNYDNKNGSTVKLSVPTEIVKNSFNKIMEKIVVGKKEEVKETNKDDIVKNILKLIK